MNKDNYVDNLKKAINYQNSVIKKYEEFIIEKLGGTIKKSTYKNMYNELWKGTINIRIPDFIFGLEVPLDILEMINNIAPKYNLDKKIEKEKVISGTELIKYIKDHKIDKGAKFFKESNGCCGNLCEFDGSNLINKEDRNNIISLAEISYSKFHFKEVVNDESSWIKGDEIIQLIDQISDMQFFYQFNTKTGEKSIVKFVKASERFFDIKTYDNLDISEIVDSEFKILNLMTLSEARNKYLVFKGRYTKAKRIVDDNWIDIKGEETFNDLEYRYHYKDYKYKEWELK